MSANLELTFDSLTLSHSCQYTLNHYCGKTNKASPSEIIMMHGHMAATQCRADTWGLTTVDVLKKEKERTGSMKIIKNIRTLIIL